jgi:single-stranded DNA-binding protein
MESFSQVVIRGRLGSNKDGEVLTPNLVQGGTNKYWRFSVAVDKKRVDKTTRQTVVETDWISCTCWDERIVHQNFHKGQLVQVTGKLTTYGEKVEGSDLLKTRLSVVAERVQPVMDESSSWEPIPSGSGIPSGSVPPRF